MNKKRLCFLLFILVSCSNIGEKIPLNFIPQPELVVVKEGTFTFSDETKVFIPKEFEADFEPYLSEKILNDVGYGINIIPGNATVPSNYIQFEKSNNKTIEEEGYIIEIHPSKILVKAKSYAGMFYGFQTIRQALPLNPGLLIDIPCMVIKDNPHFEWRGLLLDVSRHFRSKEFVMKQIDIISSYKINKFHWHLTDDQGWRIEIKKYPKLTEKGAWRADRTGVPWKLREPATVDEPKTIGGFYTQEDIKEVIDFARIRNVEIIPEIDVPGHSKALLASYPFLSCLDDTLFEVAVGQNAPDNTLCVGKETTYKFLENVISEIADLFPSTYIHIGGDECDTKNWMTCRHCQKVMQKNNIYDGEQLESYFVGRMNKMISSKRKTMIGWDEILSGKGAKGATIMAWRRKMSYRKESYTAHIDAPKAGYPTIMASYNHSYLCYAQGPVELEPEAPSVIIPLSKVYSFNPISEKLTEEEAKMVLGTEVCLWSEYISTDEHCEYMLYPRTLANAEVAWSKPEVKNWKRFQQAIRSHFKRLDRDNVTYSTSMFNIYASFAKDQLHNIAIVYLQTETVGYNIFYTVDENEPSENSIKYEGAFSAQPNTTIKAGLFDKNGQLLGKITELKI